MKVALFIPCYVDQFYPQVARASLELLERLGLDVDYPLGQTCCGQPMANAGCEQDAIPAMENMVACFQDYDYIVGPSGSCVYHIRKHYDILPQSPAVQHVRKRSFELCEFIHRVLQVDEIGARFPFRVGLHQSCHALRGLRQGRGSERVGQDYSYLREVLSKVKDIELVPLNRVDECCGFGGTFAISERGVSVKMGLDRLADHQSSGAEVITAGDMSCLMHLEGLAKRQKQPVRFLHIAEILNHR